MSGIYILSLNSEYYMRNGYQDLRSHHEGNLICVLWLNFQQAVNGISQISFSAEESISPKKLTSLAEVAKQRELSGTLESEADMKLKKQLSDAKSKELSGHDIFGPPPEIAPRSLAAARSLESKESKDTGEPVPRSIRTSVKVSNVSLLWMRVHHSQLWFFDSSLQLVSLFLEINISSRWELTVNTIVLYL